MLDFKLILNTDSSEIRQLLLDYDSRNILKEYLPELTDLKGVESEGGMSHKDNFYHTLKVVENTYKKTSNINLRLVSILHDIGKCPTKSLSDNGWTFHNHEFVGAKMLRKIFNRFELDYIDYDYVKLLVENHGYPKELYKDVVTDSGIRRFYNKMGNMLEDLLLFCKCDITTKFDWKRIKQQKEIDSLLVTINQLKLEDEKNKWRCPVTGKHIMEHYGSIDGKEIGKIKNKIENAIKKGIIDDTYEAGMEFMLNLDIDKI